MANISTNDSALEGFAEDLGKLLGNARNKAEGWLGQREAITEHLTGIRDTANQLLSQLGLGTSEPAAPAGRATRRRASGPAAEAAAAPAEVAETRTARPRQMSEEARARISAAQKKRWAKHRRAKAKG
jgi:hypothetical protein